MTSGGVTGVASSAPPRTTSHRPADERTGPTTLEEHPVAEHQNPNDPQNPPPAREREIIVTNDGGGRGGGTGAIVAVVALVAVVVILLFVFNVIGGGGAGGEGGGDTNVEVPVPDDIEVDVTDAGGGEG